LSGPVAPRPQQRRFKPNNGGTWIEEVAPYASLCDQAVVVRTRAGDAELMHGQLYHAGAGASEAGPRIVLTLAFRSVDELASEPSNRCRPVRGQRIHRGRGETWAFAVELSGHPM
jgi:hypothetical protein